MRWVDETTQDVRYALWGFRRTAGFTVIAVLTLALGTGANLAIFNVIEASKRIGRLILGVTGTDASTIASAVAILTAVGGLSPAVPARRARAVDPVLSMYVE